MSVSLDKFLPPYQVKPKQDPKITVRDKCAKCGKPILSTEPKYTLRVKGKEGFYHQTCAKQILRPQENMEENL
jgi:hypothetical protein